MQLVLMVALLAQAEQVDRIGIFQVQVSGVEASLQGAAIDTLATAVARLPRRQVVTRSELDAMIGAESIKDAVGCNDVSCMAEIGAAAGVRYIITGSISKLEQALLVSLQLIDTKLAAAQERVTLRWEGATSRLDELLGLAAEELVLTREEKRAGALVLSGVPAGAIVQLDGKPMAFDGGLNDLAPGIHTLRVEADGFLPFDGPVIVRSGSVTPTRITLAEEPAAPLYTRWWFWTGAVALAAGAVTTAVLVSGGDDPQKPTGSGSFSVNVPFESALRRGGR